MPGIVCLTKETPEKGGITMRKCETMYEEAHRWNTEYDGILPDVAAIPTLWAVTGDNMQRNALLWAHGEALKMNAEIDAQRSQDASESSK
ncbi:hypothetical protein D9798_23030 [Salmonella enterica]|nr:hypothetical protein [Salmonella enterica]MKY59355.1 hypothetical protein [Salmonella enterica]